MDLEWEPYQTELDELVEKEIAMVVSKNEERKKRKGKERTNSTPTTSGNDLNNWILQVEDFMERWDKKLEMWGTMISELYEVQFRKSAPQIPTELVNEGENFQRVPFVVSGESKDSADDKDSVKSYTDDDSEEGGTYHEQDDQSADKSLPLVKYAGKQKEVVTEKGGVEVPERGWDKVQSRKEPEVCNSKFKVLLPQSLKRKVRVTLSFL